MLTLFTKSFREARWLLAGSAAVVFGFQWLYVWMVSQLPMENFARIMGAVPPQFLKLLPIPIEQLLTIPGRIGMSYAEPVILIVVAVWGIGRGSDAVSGELGRGTLEMLLAQPVSRMAVLISNAAVTILGCAAIGLAAWLGTAVGLAIMEIKGEPPATAYLPSAGNVFALGFFLAGATTALSAADRYRWRTIGIAGAAFIVEKIIEVIAQTVAAFAWLERLTFFTLFKPPRFVTDKVQGMELFWQYSGLLVAMGLVAYIAAAVIFTRRDLPAPL